ncbi:MAG: hypothetical protein IT204_20585 [Fimbriimonadaceae bacterium]|nr:hypothetical protein [Fimbriimonadaceae bacterium]
MPERSTGRRAWLRGGMLLWAAAWLAGGPLAAETPAEVKARHAARGRLADATGIFNSRIAAQVGSDGRYNFGAYPNGASSASGPNSFNLSYSWPNGPGSSYTTIRVDGNDIVYGTDGTALTVPVSTGDENVSAWQYGDLVVAQRLVLVNGPNSGLADTVQIEYTIANTGTVPHDVGVRVMWDTMLAGNDSAPFRVPGVGALTTEMEFSGTGLPGFWFAFNDLSDAATAAQGTLVAPGAVAPDRFIIGSWSRLQSTKWDYTAQTGSPNGDSGVAMYWNPQTIAPNSTRQVATYYGLGSQSVAGAALLLGVTAPTGVDTTANDQFAVVATVENLTTNTVPQVALNLAVPQGFTVLAQRVAGDPAQFDAGDLGPGATAQVTWDVQVGGQVASGDYSFTVHAASSDPNVPQTDVPRQIHVKAANAVAPEQCDLTVDPASLDPDGHLVVGQPAVFVLTLRNADGVPLAAHPLGSIQLDVTGPDQPTVTAGSTTDANGRATFGLTPRVAGDYVFKAVAGSTVYGQPLNLTAVAAGEASAIYTLQPGLHLLNVPLQQATVLNPAALHGLQFIGWDPLQQRYLPGDPTAGLPGPATGFFVRVQQPTELRLDGLLNGLPLDEPLETAGADTVQELLDDRGSAPRGAARTPLDFGDLAPGWNLVGNRGGEDLEWHLAAFDVLLDGNLVGNWSNPATWDYVAPYAFVWAGPRYALVFDPSLPGFENQLDVIPPLTGFWMYRRAAAGRVQLVPHAGGGQAPLARRGAAPGSWAVPLQATAGGQSAEVICGVRSGLARALQVAAPPNPLAGGLTFQLLGQGRALAAELQPGRARSYRFEAQVGAPAGQAVVLTWPALLRALPAGWQAVLHDPTSGQRWPLQQRSSYRYVASAAPRQFVLEFAPGGAGRLALQLGGTASRSRGAALTLTLSRAATVQVQVTSLTGRLVRELRYEAEAGSQAVTWDGHDTAGRPVPAGTYRLLAIAQAPDGEVARASSIVSVP